MLKGWTLIAAGMALTGSICVAGSITLAPGQSVAGVTVTSEYAAEIGANPLYKGSNTVSNNPLYQDGKRLTEPGFNDVGKPSINPSGVIAFQSVSDTPDLNGIFVRPPSGGVLITITGSNFRDASGAPVINATGQVAFKDIVILGNGGPVVRLASATPGGGQPITIFGTDFGVRGSPTLNDAGDVCAEGTVPGTTTSALFVRPAGGGNYVTINGSSFGGTGLRSPQLVDRHLTATGTYSDGTSQVMTYTLASDSTVSGVGPLKWMAPESIRNRLQSSLLPGGTSAGGDLMAICDDDSIRICGTTDHFFAALSPAVTTQVVIRLGDALDGSTVTDLSLAPQSWSSEDSLTFYAALANGNTGLYVYTLPEPATLTTLVAVVPILRRKR